MTIRVIFSTVEKANIHAPFLTKKPQALRSHKHCWLPPHQLDSLLNRVSCPLKAGDCVVRRLETTRLSGLAEGSMQRNFRVDLISLPNSTPAMIGGKPLPVSSHKCLSSHATPPDSDIKFSSSPIVYFTQKNSPFQWRTSHIQPRGVGSSPGHSP